MSLPAITTLKILGLDYTIIPMRGVVADCADCYGFIDDRALEIHIRSDLPPQRMAETFLHEIHHALVDGMAAADSEDGDEALVSRLGRGMAAFIRDNPEFMYWLQESLK